MPEPETTSDGTPTKASKKPLILGLLLALFGGVGGFYATWSGTILGTESSNKTEAEYAASKAEDVYFVPVDPLVISLGDASNARHLRFRANLEVPTPYKDEVKNILPRVVDVLNSYLRALDASDLEERAALTRLRAQMLRRVQVVVGPGRVNDLLVMEFVLN